MIYIQMILVFIIFLLNVNVAYIGMKKNKPTLRLHMLSLLLIIMIIFGPIYITNLLANLPN